MKYDVERVPTILRRLEASGVIVARSRVRPFDRYVLRSSRACAPGVPILLVTTDTSSQTLDVGDDGTCRILRWPAEIADIQEALFDDLSPSGRLSP